MKPAKRKPHQNVQTKSQEKAAKAVSRERQLHRAESLKPHNAKSVLRSAQLSDLVSSMWAEAYEKLPKPRRKLTKEEAARKARKAEKKARKIAAEKLRKERKAVRRKECAARQAELLERIARKDTKFDQPENELSRRLDTLYQAENHKPFATCAELAELLIGSPPATPPEGVSAPRAASPEQPRHLPAKILDQLGELVRKWIDTGEFSRKQYEVMSEYMSAMLPSSIPFDMKVMQFKEEMEKIHGPVIPRREASGLHLYMACPKCLEEYGRRELRSRHLAVNVEKMFGHGIYSEDHKDPNARKGRSGKKRNGYAQCMKQHGRFDVADLRRWPTLEERGIDNFMPVLTKFQDQERYLVPDDEGRMIPDHPGVVVSLTSLPHTHPVMTYLASRGYDPVKLSHQFKCAWCVKEAPEGDEYGNRWYRKHLGEWKTTPQGRLIFYSFVNGYQACWQGRYLELAAPPGFDRPLVWHPYRERWEARPDWPKGQDPAKYNTAPGSFRNSQLCGYDAVIEASSLRKGPRVCVLTEGPLDAARFPEHGLAVLGKYLSPQQAMLVGIHFDYAVLAFDADKAGQEACKAAEELFSDMAVRGLNVKTIRFFTESECADATRKLDVGMMGYEACAERLYSLVASI